MSFFSAAKQMKNSLASFLAAATCTTKKPKCFPMRLSFSCKPSSILFAWWLVVSALFPISPASAQIVRLELHVIQTQSPTEQEFLNGKKDANPATISGELRIPRTGSDRLPAVILLHGSGGPSGLQDNWAREFAALGIATFIVDSFTGRGISSTQDNQDQLSRLAHIGDAYRALEVLGKHPRIDPTRVAVMGFSRDGEAAHYAALKRFNAMHGPAGGLAFAGYVALYPTCNRDIIDGMNVADRPIRIFHRLADDYVPAAECRAYVARLGKAGKDITLTEYPGTMSLTTRHLRPPSSSRRRRRHAAARAWRRCQLAAW